MCILFQYYWTIVVLIRKLSIASALLFFSSEDPEFQALMIIYILSIAAIAQYFAQPSKLREDGSDLLNSIEMFSLLVSILILVGGLGMTSTKKLLRSMGSIEDPSIAVQSQVVAYNSKLLFVTILCLVSMSVLFLMYLFAVVKSASARSKALAKATVAASLPLSTDSINPTIHPITQHKPAGPPKAEIELKKFDTVNPAFNNKTMSVEEL